MSVQSAAQGDDVPLPTDGGERPWDDPELLRHLHHDQEMSTAEIGARLGCTGGNIKYHMKKHGVEARTFHRERPWTDREEFERLYIGEGLNYTQMAERWDTSISTISTWQGRHGFEDRWRAKGAHYVMHTGGYMQWEDTSKGHPRVYVHQLLAISEGADPRDLFGGGIEVHHVNGIPWDNRPSNLELAEKSEHTSDHQAEIWKDAPWRDKAKVEEGLETYTVRALAEVWECSPGTIRDWKDRHGLPQLKPGRATDKIEVSDL